MTCPLFADVGLAAPSQVPDGVALAAGIAALVIAFVGVLVWARLLIHDSYDDLFNDDRTPEA